MNYKEIEEDKKYMVETIEKYLNRVDSNGGATKSFKDEIRDYYNLKVDRLSRENYFKDKKYYENINNEIVQIIDNDVDNQYLKLIKDVKENGVEKLDRTNVGTISSFFKTLKFNLNDGFPILTTKKVLFDTVKDELLFFLSGSTNINDLQPKSRAIWKDWADENGGLGAVYSKQMRNWVSYHKYSREKYLKMTSQFNNYYESITLENGFIKYEVDQIKKIIWLLKNDPYSRRIVLNLWNVGELWDMCLLPCHFATVFNCTPLSLDERISYYRKNYKISRNEQSHELLDKDGVPKFKLNCHVTLRSNDLFLGNPFNISSYALFTHLLASVANMQVGELAMSIVDAHIYSNHVEQVELQLNRYDKQHDLPTLKLNKKADLFDYTLEDIWLEGYEHESFIKAPIAV